MTKALLGGGEVPPRRETMTWPTPDDIRAALRAGTGQGVKVAVIDSGVEIAHPALAGLDLHDDLAVEISAGQSRVVSGEGVDLYGHGTAVASIVRENAPEAAIGSFRVLGARNRGKLDAIGEGVRQALARGYRILNCSFGSSNPDHLLKFKSWIDAAYLGDVHIVAGCSNVDFTEPEWPGHFPSVIGVNMARTERSDVLFRRGGHLIEFAARGVDLNLPWKGGTHFPAARGSSYAAPVVTAMAARILSVYPGLPPLLLKTLLREVAEPWIQEIASNNEPSPR